ncbi:HesA/MoeB/ThiF family protein [Candidatus Woesearchaeota archaeon]|mgnify:FL=1|jgi:molybdopterin-synthase adenylyltransferase|nr:HesA/MoeB/ThiF family protein [Candidatus Woesearchaeota archaeon]MBT6518691.1 HesA/MoeB/ThiF family protein [Candidatus Woesearchaeota archaeon]MBT7368387.1 HesA/MoeB/ThiF family protein [Candidatus Woesearchaeota archaeon]
MKNRYSRQEIFEKIGKKGQQKLLNSKVVVVGVGALGTTVCDLLARAGIGEIILIDHDVIDQTNLQRQTLFCEEDIGKPKASTAKKYLEKINSEIKIIAHDDHLNNENVTLLDSDVVVDCTDNIDTRFLINEYCKKEKINWVHGAAIRDKGTMFVFSFGLNGLNGLNDSGDLPCFKCIFPNISQGESCEEAGVLGAVTNIIGSIQANETIKLLVGLEHEKDLLRLNLLDNNIDKIKVNKNSECSVCAGDYSCLMSAESGAEFSIESTELSNFSKFTIQKCKTKAGWSAKPKQNLKLNLDAIKQKYETIMDTPILLVIDCEGEIIVHNYGEILFKELKDEEKMKKIVAEIYDTGK